MSGWRLVVHDIAAADDGVANPAALGHDYTSIHRAETLGLIGRVTNHVRTHGQPTLYALTAFGIEFLEGRVVQAETRPGGRRWVATWLRSLPQGVRVADGMRACDLTRVST